MESPTVPTPTRLPEEPFDPLEFWIRHKTKIVFTTFIVALALLVYGLYTYQRQRSAQAAEAAFLSATSAADFRKVIADYPHSSVAGTAHLRLAELLRHESKFEESNRILRQFIEQQPEHPLISSAYMSLGANAEAEGKADEAITAYKKVISTYPTSYSLVAAWMGQARVLKQQGREEEARQAYEKVFTQYTESAFVNEAFREAQKLKPAPAAPAGSAAGEVGAPSAPPSGEADSTAGAASSAAMEKAAAPVHSSVPAELLNQTPGASASPAPSTSSPSDPASTASSTEPPPAVVPPPPVTAPPPPAP